MPSKSLGPRAKANPDADAVLPRLIARAYWSLFLLAALVGGVKLFQTPSAGAAAASEHELSATEGPDRIAALQGQWRNANSAAAIARQKADNAERQLFLFLDSQFMDYMNERLKPFSSSIRGRHFVDVEDDASIVPPSERVPNPQRLALEQQLREAQIQREKLLVNLTPEHPLVKDVDLGIAELNRRLAAFPPEPPAGAANGLPGLPFSNPQPTAADQHRTILEQNDQMWGHYRKMQMDAWWARKESVAAAETEATTLAALQKAETESRSENVTAVAGPVAAGSVASPSSANESPSPAAPQPTASQPSVRPAVCGLLVAFSMWAGFMLARRKRRPAGTFNTAAEIESALGLPILGRFELAGR